MSENSTSSVTYTGPVTAAASAPVPSDEPAQAETNWDQLREQWEKEKLTPAQVAESLKNSRKWETRAKENHTKLKEAEPILSQWKALEESTKTDVERAKESEARQLARSEKLQTKLVSASVKALAAADFVDPSDALAALDPSKYLGLEDEIDEAAIQADLAALLERKPHWRRASEQGVAAPRVPAPNPAQGSGVNGKAATDPAAAFASLIQSQLK